MRVCRFAPNIVWTGTGVAQVLEGHDPFLGCGPRFECSGITKRFPEGSECMACVVSKAPSKLVVGHM